jgi:hypothetical protein
LSNEPKDKNKNIFKKIIRENWEEFKKRYPRFDKPYYNDAVKKMLGCGEKENGYVCYVCCSCGEMITVNFSCKSSFCLTCGKVYTDNWVDQISEILYEGMCYRHVVLTIPEELRKYFFEEPTLLAELMKIGPQMLTEALSYWFKEEVEVGFIVVLQTAGRSGHYNPHLHIIMTSGGMSKISRKWRSLGYINFELLHKKWQYFLFTMLKDKIGTPEIREIIARLYKQYPDGLVAFIDKGKMPHNSQGLARYLVKYVVSPPIAISRILEYDGKKVVYWYKDHKTGKKETATVDVLTFVGLMVQHILPKGFQRIRYYGLQATAKRPKVLLWLKKIVHTVTRAISGVYKIIKKTFRQRMIDSGCQDPLKCNKCGDEMVLYFIWHPGYGYIYDFWDGSEECREPQKEAKTGPRTSGFIGHRERIQVQMLMPFMQI